MEIERNKKLYDIVNYSVWFIGNVCSVNCNFRVKNRCILFHSNIYKSDSFKRCKECIEIFDKRILEDVDN